jgi:uncharacterized protein
MQFVILARDAPGEETLQRRMSARTEHMKGVRDLKQGGRIIDGGALLDEEGNMCGSLILCDFPDRAALDGYLDSEIFQREGIWRKIEVLPFRRIDWEALMRCSPP